MEDLKPARIVHPGGIIFGEMVARKMIISDLSKEYFNDSFWVDFALFDGDRIPCTISELANALSALFPPTRYVFWQKILTNYANQKGVAWTP